MKRATFALALAALAAGCGGSQSAAGGDGVDGVLIARLFDGFLWTTGAIYLGVVAWLIVAALRKREPVASDPRGWRIALTIFAGLSALTLTGLSAATWLTDRSLAREPRTPLEIEVTGRQFWWDVRYRDPVAGNWLHTANELHLPLGRPAHVTLKTADVIHSLWIPNLAGKQDLIPGRETDLLLEPRRTGVFRGQCAEFCGAQHAHMALDVTVESPADFARWYAAGLVVPAKPASGDAAAGLALFENRPCASCHTIAGTQASGSNGPDLSHVASRRSIAAGTLPMDHQSLAIWISDPQAIKPGTNMPKVPMPPAEVEALAAYLETLK